MSEGLDLSIDDLPKLRKRRRWPRYLGAGITTVAFVGLIGAAALFLRDVGLPTRMASCTDLLASVQTNDDASKAVVAAIEGAQVRNATLEGFFETRNVRCWQPWDPARPPHLRTQDLALVTLTYEQPCSGPRDTQLAATLPPLPFTQYLLGSVTRAGGGAVTLELPGAEPDCPAR